MDESEIKIEDAIKRIEEGELTTDVIDVILEEHLKDLTDTKYLEIISNAFVKFAKPVEWKQYESSLQMFAQASIEDNKSIQILSPIFLREDMLEFTKTYFMHVSKLIKENPDRIVNVLLYITSRAAQKSQQFYPWAVKALFSAIFMNLGMVYFEDLIEPFAKFIDFQPELTVETLQEIMSERFRYMNISLESKNIDQSSNYANETFLNSLKFLCPFAFRYAKYKAAFIALALRSLHEDPSLKLNPFRVKVIQILMDRGHYLECVAQLTKILTKSLQEKKVEGTEFDWDKLIVADKEIARDSAYQEILFQKSFDMLKLCLDKLSNRIAYPEIVAPVVRALKNIVDTPIFQSKQSVLKQFIKNIEKNSKKIEAEREKVASKPGFDITKTIEI